ncbi:DUF6350 family protein [Demequina sp. SO4-13]|uniref:cell division protein PerM n=1 Tax=Demequina sp. SO4-13 TaxID=3401027 RepID=UPI003AF48EAF
MSTRSLATDLRVLAGRAVAAVRAAPAWLGGILTGLQGLALSYLALLAPSLAVAASAPSDGVGGAEWSGATSVATGLWLLGHGVPVHVGDAVVGLVPLGLTLLCGAILAALARRFAARTWGSWALAVATYAAGVGTIASLVDGSQRTHVVGATVVAVVVAAVGTAVGIWRAHGVQLAWLARVPVWARAGARRGAGSALVMIMLAAVTGAVWGVAGRHAIGDVATSLDLDLVSAVVLAIAQLAYVPTMIVWMVAWLAGPGFAVGLDTAYSPSVISVDVLPAFPVLGALPSTAGGLLVWAPVLLALAALLARLTVRRPALSWRQDAAADAVAAGLVCAAAAVAFAATSGAAGPARLETVGPDVVVATAAVAALTIAGLVTGTLALRVPSALLERRARGRQRSRREATTVA